MNRWEEAKCTRCAFQVQVPPGAVHQPNRFHLWLFHRRSDGASAWSSKLQENRAEVPLPAAAHRPEITMIAFAALEL